MKPFETFYIEWFEFDKSTLIARFFYSFDHTTRFTEEIYFSDSEFEIQAPLNNHTIDTFLFHISIALGISYYKLYPTPEIIVETGFLDSDARVFWNRFYTLWLGEFFYRKNIDPRGLANFVSRGEHHYQKQTISVRDRAIVPVGGWKDSIVTIEKILASWIDMDLFTFGKENRIYSDTAEISEQQRLLVRRKLSETLFILNREGYYNGHVPITGVISFVLTFVAYLYSYKYIVFSNEQSSNFGNLEFYGMEINHQYSKSIDFENEFRTYIARYVSDNIIYFSMMRPYYEVNIIQQFSKHRAYFQSFTSCNTNFTLLSTESKTDRWCRKCPKCAFVFACLHPCISHDEITQIFGDDMYTDASLIPLFRELAWVSGHKPFECVGTNEEILWSMHKSIETFSDNPLPIVLQDIQKQTIHLMPKESWEVLETKLFHEYEHHIPLIFRHQ